MCSITENSKILITHDKIKCTDIQNEITVDNIHSKKSCGGGCNTNLYGKMFESRTCNENYLLKNGFKKIIYGKKQSHYYISKIYEDKIVTFVSQNGLKYFMKQKYKIDIFRCPDEAYIIK
jgi:hypothetical protein